MLKDRARAYGPLSNRGVVVAITIAMLLGIFFVEITTPQQIAIPVLYTIPLFFSMWFLDARLIYLVWGATMVMTIMGNFFSPGPIDPFTIWNRSIALVVICGIGYLGVRRKRLEMRLRDVTIELEASNATLSSLEKEANRERARSEFYVDLLTHDINNYNAVALGYLQLSQDTGTADDKVSKAMGALEDSTELIGTVKQLHLAKGRTGAGGEVDLNDLLLGLIKELAPPPDRPVSVRYEPAPGRMVDAPGLLRDAVQNILWNAVVHTTGEVCIWVELASIVEEGAGYHLISISDSGQGIPDELKGKVFQRRSRGRTDSKGSGLGLYLVKVILEELGGRAWVEDRVPGDSSQGAMFRLLVPAAR